MAPCAWDGSAGAPLAIVAAVLVAVSHNFFWHERVTWPDRPRAGRFRRWLSFHLSTGAVSVAANVGMTTAVTTVTGLPLVPANAVAVVASSLASFLVSDRLVFRS